MQTSAPPPLSRGHAGALAAAVLLVVWGAAWWTARGSAVAPLVPAAALPLLGACAGSAALLRAHRVTGADRHLWRWLGLAVLSWGLSSAFAGGLGWSRPDGGSPGVSAVGAVLLACTVSLTAVALVPVVRGCTTGAGLLRDALDSALLTAVVATVLWFQVLAPGQRGGSAAVLSTPLAVVLLVEVLVAVVTASVTVRARRRHPGLELFAVAVLLLVGSDLATTALAGTAQAGTAGWPTDDVVAWCSAAACCAVVAGAGRRPRPVAAPDAASDAAPDAGRGQPVPGGGSALPCVAALLALASSAPPVVSGHHQGAVGAWLHVTVLSLLLARGLLLVRDGDQLLRGLEGQVADRTRALASSERRSAALVVHGSDVVLVVDAAGTCTYASPSLQGVVGRAPQTLLGEHLAALFPADPAGRSPVVEALAALRAGSGSRSAVRATAPHASGRALTLDVTLTDLLDDPAVRGVVLNARDVSQAVRLEEELSRQAFSDALTGLPNRALFRDRVEHALRGRGTRSPVEVCYLDLDGFKAVNDALGHGAGDELLVAVAERLRAAVREGDTVARLGGDEFAVLLDESAGPQDAERLAQRLCEAVRRPFTVRGAQVRVATSLGLASTATTGLDANRLLRSADLAMYQAKGEHQGGYAFYHPRMHERLLERVQLEADLRRAVDEGQFRVVYQPLVDMGTSSVTGVEALVRWHHPERGVVPPTAFIPLAENTGLIDAVGAFVLREACHQVAAWRAEVPGAEQMRLSVNVSAHQLDDPDLVRSVVDVLADSGLPATSLVLEVTESALVEGHETALSTLEELRALGVRLAIDDFGTGYSSLSYLHRLPVDVLKIDKSFVDRLSETQDTSLVEAILGMAATLGLTAVAEGVEHEHQRVALAAQGCATGQGYHFSPPVDAAEVPALVMSAAAAAGRRSAAVRGSAPGRRAATEVAR